jgi:hypothetical protein
MVAGSKIGAIGEKWYFQPEKLGGLYDVSL